MIIFVIHTASYHVVKITILNVATTFFSANDSDSHPELPSKAITQQVNASQVYFDRHKRLSQNMRVTRPILRNRGNPNLICVVIVLNLAKDFGTVLFKLTEDSI